MRLLRLDKVRLSLLDLLFSEGYVHQLEFDQLNIRSTQHLVNSTFCQLEFDQLNIQTAENSINSTFDQLEFDQLGVAHTIIFLSQKKM